MLKSTGFKNVKANVVFTPTSNGTVTLELYVNENSISSAVSTYTCDTTGDTITFNINDVIRVVLSVCGNVANLSVRINANGTLVGGTLIVEDVR